MAQDLSLEGSCSEREYLEVMSFLAERARNDFYTYCLLCNPPNETPFIFSKVHQHLMTLVQDVFEGRRGKRQAVSLPPQHGKSKTLSIEAVSWILGKNPSLNIAITGFSHELVTDFSLAIKDRVSTSLYKSIFPEVVIDTSTDRADYWRTTGGGAVRAKSVGKKLTGRRVDWLIVDDAHAGRDEANSRVQREKVIKGYLGDCRSRLSPEASVFLIGTRWHPEDLIGTLTNPSSVRVLETFGAEGEVFEVTNFPAVCENENTDVLGRKAGEALFPEVRDEDFLNNVKAGFAAEGALYEWDSQYQGRPSIQGGGVTDVNAIPIIEESQVPEDIELVRGWDLAVSEKEIADYTASAKIGLDKRTGNLYIIKIYRNQLAWPKNEKLIVELARRERIRIRIEAIAGFLACYQTVKKQLLGICNVTKSTPSGDKLVRANKWLPKAEAGKLYFVRGEWNQEFKDELEAFPVGANDDMVDAVSIAYEMCDYIVRKDLKGGARPKGGRRPEFKERPQGRRGRVRGVTRQY